MNSLNIFISKYKNTYSTLPESVTIIDELDRIRNGFYKTDIELCRNLFQKGDIISYKKKKTELQALTFSGQFEGSHKKENILNYSKFIVVDLDSIPIEKIDLIKKNLNNDKHIIAVWLSPSGVGLKILIKVLNSLDNHRICFDTICNYLETQYSVTVDKSGSDICRLCYVSFDPQIIINETSEPFVFEQFLTIENIGLTCPIPHESQLRQKQIEKILINEKKSFFASEGRNMARNRRTIDLIIKYLCKYRFSITMDYHSWFKVACAIANSFTYDIGLKYFLRLCRLDNEYHDEYKSQRLLEYIYRNKRSTGYEFSTIVFLAKKKGFLNKKNDEPTTILSSEE